MKWTQKKGDDLTATCGPLKAYVRAEEGYYEWWLGDSMRLPFGITKTSKAAQRKAEKAMGRILSRMTRDFLRS